VHARKSTKGERLRFHRREKEPKIPGDERIANIRGIKHRRRIVDRRTQPAEGFRKESGRSKGRNHLEKARVLRKRRRERGVTYCNNERAASESTTVSRLNGLTASAQVSKENRGIRETRTALHCWGGRTSEGVPKNEE